MSVGKPSIGIFCPGAGSGGPWRYVHSILAALDPTEFDVTVYCDLPGEYEPQPWVQVVRLGAAVTHASGAVAIAPEQAAPSERPIIGRLVPKPLRVWAGFGAQCRRLARLIRQHPVDLFHTQNTGCEESPVAAKLAGVRRVLGTFHVDSTYDLHRERSGPTYRILEMISNRCLDSAIAVSRATRRDWLRRTHISADRVTTIHNGIDPDAFQRRRSRDAARRTLGLPERALIVGGLGRLDEAKGFVYLLDAAARLRPEFPDLYVVIAGEGDLRKELEAETARRGMTDRVRFLGFQSDVQVVLDSLDVFALPSLCEALAYALLEAMATDLPVVASAVGGVPEVVVPGETGFLVPRRHPVALADALRTLLRNTDLRARLGAVGRRRVVRDFHERDMAGRTIHLYSDLLGLNAVSRGLKHGRESRS